MLTASPITSQTVGKTFTVAISTLGVGAVLQLGIIVWAFATRPADAVASLVAENPPALAKLTTPALSTPDFTAPVISEPPQQLTTTPSPGPRKPTPAPQKAAPAEPTNHFEEALLQGKMLRERGDINAALVKFREAASMDPKNPVAIAELAATYEKMGAADRAAEHWRKIYDMGDAAGVYFSLAERILKSTQALELQNATKQPTESTPDTSAVEGIAAGATLGLLPLRTEDEPDANSAKRFTLHVPIKARPKTKMEVRDLIIHVLFYDIVDGQNVVQTSANVSSRWMTPPADWLETDTEELAVEYQLPKAEAKAAKRENRKYFGYIVRVYYKQQLQAATAEPERLAQQYPPPPTLLKDPDK
jgi:tetratricopeptide (TPR) repeat protein